MISQTRSRKSEVEGPLTREEGMAVLMAHGEAEAEIVADDPAQLADIEKAAAEHRAAGRINHARFNGFIAAKAWAIHRQRANGRATPT